MKSVTQQRIRLASTTESPLVNRQPTTKNITIALIWPHRIQVHTKGDNPAIQVLVFSHFGTLSPFELSTLHSPITLRLW